MITLAVVALALAALPALVYLRNAGQFTPPPPAPRDLPSRPPVSVLIPARNEEGSIAACLESVLASRDVELEVIVLDDHSEDRMADVVRDIAARDPRVRLAAATPLPAGWCGKQHACYVLSGLASHPVLSFLDADVRLTPDALARMVSFLHRSGAALVSGFPRQETGTLLEKLVIPLIHWLLVCYLPMGRMRASADPRFGVGCGQWFMTTRETYDAVGGHSAVKASLHDGVTLPRAYRAAGFMADVCDASTVATCRMYHSAGQVWNGLAKNAREGLGAPGLIWVWTILLGGGHVLPFVLFGVLVSIDTPGLWNPFYFGAEAFELMHARFIAFLGCVVSTLIRFDVANRYQSSQLGALLHPVGVAILLAVQWYATLRAWVGRPIGWKGRQHPSSAHEKAHR